MTPEEKSRQVERGHALQDQLTRGNENRKVQFSRDLKWDCWPPRPRIQSSDAGKLYSRLTGLELMPAVQLDRSMYNWLRDAAYLTQDGDAGLIQAYECFGALPGDGVDIHFHLLLPDDSHIHFLYGTDYSQSLMPVHVSGHAENRVKQVLASTINFLEKLCQSEN